jgi:tryptophanyl-tRNA synthetase
MKTFLSGIKPTGKLHLGNYFGAIKQFLDLQKEHQGFVMIADYHALNFVQDREMMLSYTQELILGLLACGLNTQKLTIFKQSEVSEHTELTWIFDTITPMAYLKRAHAYKDAKAKNKEISVGTFNYPMLMATDILLYSPDLVPVGRDQQQHVEITRDTAEKFNYIYKQEVFKLPEAMILDDVATVPGTDGQKMSKSYNNTIPLFAEDDEIRRLVMAIVTDSGSDIPKNVYAIHSLIKPRGILDSLYEENKGKYKNLKDSLADDLISFIAPLREKRKEIEANPDLVNQILDSGKEKAKTIASKKMGEVRKAIGVKI